METNGEIKFCPRCNKRVYFSFDSTDIVHDCRGFGAGSVLGTDDKVDITRGIQFQGMTNKIAGTRGHMQYGAKEVNLTKQGRNSQVYTTSNHEEYIELDKK